MAGYNSRTLPSDPDFRLALVSDIGDKSESDDVFDGWLGPDDGPALVRDYSDTDGERSPSPQQCSVSVDMGLASESPLRRAASPSHSSRHSSPTFPMQANPSLSPTHSPLHFSTPLTQQSPSAPISTQHTSSRATAECPLLYCKPWHHS